MAKLEELVIKNVNVAVKFAGTQMELAKQIGVTRQMVSRWLRTGKINLYYYDKITEYIKIQNKRQ